MTLLKFNFRVFFVSLCEVNSHIYYIQCTHSIFQDGHEISTFSAMCQSGGQWHLPLPKCQCTSVLSIIILLQIKKKKHSPIHFLLLAHINMSLFCYFPVIDCEEPEPLLNGGMTFQNQYHTVVQYHCNEPFYIFPGGENGEIYVQYILLQTSNEYKINFLIYLNKNKKKQSPFFQLLSAVNQMESGDPNTAMSLLRVYLVLTPCDI